MFAMDNSRLVPTMSLVDRHVVILSANTGNSTFLISSIPANGSGSAPYLWLVFDSQFPSLRLSGLNEAWDLVRTQHSRPCVGFD